MKKWVVLALLMIVLAAVTPAVAQCSICTKTAQQLGEKPAKALNGGIMYLAFAPFAIVGFIAYKWWKGNRSDSK
jgi:hypothetical protein